MATILYRNNKYHSFLALSGDMFITSYFPCFNCISNILYQRLQNKEIYLSWLYRKKTAQLLKNQNWKKYVQVKIQINHQSVFLEGLFLIIYHPWLNGTKYSRMDQVKSVEDSLWKIWKGMVCLSRPYPLQNF